MGPHVVRAVGARGLAAVSVSRRGGGPGGVALDRRDVSRLKALVRERRVTRVIDLLALTIADTEPLWSALDGEVERWVMASSCDVYRNYEGLQRKASPPPIDGLLDEDSPLRVTRYPYRSDPRRSVDAEDAWMDDYDKIPLEQALLARPDLGGMVLRLPMVFGPGDRQRRFQWLLRPMLERRRMLRVDPSWATWRTTYGFVADIADALATAATAPHQPARESVFNLGSGEIPDHQGWIDRFARVLDWRGQTIGERAAADSPIAALDLRYALQVDSRRFRTVHGWSEPTSLDDALRSTVADEAARD